MKRCKLILALWLGASAWALTVPQTLPQTPRANSPAAAKPRAAAAPPSAAAGHARSVAQSSSRRPAKRVRTTRPHSAPGTLAAKRTRAHPTRRDPFVSPIVERVRAAASCTGSGRKCLQVGEISLRGVVRSPSGPIAVVVNGDHTYFLRENDPLADGEVERITKDSIILRERSSDVAGLPSTREVTKKLGASAD